MPEIKHVPTDECPPVDSNKVEPPTIISPVKTKPAKLQQPLPPKEVDAVFVNQEIVHEQLDVQKVNKINKVVKMEQSKTVEHAAKEPTPTEDMAGKLIIDHYCMFLFF